MAISKKHHIVPQCYLKWFTHNGTQLYIYDKKEDRVRPGNIENSFYSRSRNTFTAPKGGRSDVIERLYGQVEDDCAPVLEKIARGGPADVLPLMDNYKLALFVATQFWRVPTVDDHVRDLLRKNRLADGHWHLEYPDGWTDEMREKLESQLFAHEATAKFFHLMLTFEPFYDRKYTRSLEGWKIYYQNPGFYLTCDNPMIVSSVATPQNILDELILPLAPGRILVASGAKPKELDQEWTYDVDMQLIKQADRYVAASNEGFLKAMVDAYKTGNYDLTNGLIPRIFGVVA